MFEGSIKVDQLHGASSFCPSPNHIGVRLNCL